MRLRKVRFQRKRFLEESNVDKALLEKFEHEIWSKIPHLEGDKIVNATPLIDLTNDLKECAKSIYKINSIWQV
jgi:hypothetical protein